MVQHCYDMRNTYDVTFYITNPCKIQCHKLVFKISSAFKNFFLHMICKNKSPLDNLYRCTLKITKAIIYRYRYVEKLKYLGLSPTFRILRDNILVDGIQIHKVYFILLQTSVLIHSPVLQ